jgi:1,4-alpha-glucan branching enzyme
MFKQEYQISSKYIRQIIQLNYIIIPFKWVREKKMSVHFISAYKKTPFLTEEELYLFNNGKLYYSYLKFGAHHIIKNGVAGVHFAVWAPGAIQVCIVGDFNSWCGKRHPMQLLDTTGVWALFVPGLEAGQLYKYQIEPLKGEKFLKADPFAFYSELRPDTASVIYPLEGYSWQDGEWMERRGESEFMENPLSIYEVHPGSWRTKEDGRFYNYLELATELIDYVLEMGYTHVELLPLMEHPYDGSWGYQGTGYFSCTSRYGTPHDFMRFIDQCHQSGIGVILDWVPGHFCKDAHGLGQFDGNSLYEKEEHVHWGTYKFNFAQSEVWSFLISNAIFWLECFHVDGLRVDGVSSMLYLDYGKERGVWQPNIKGGRENLEAMGFLQRLNEVVTKDYPGVLMIAEEATDWPLVTWPSKQNGLGFSLKWNMGWMNDILRYMQSNFPERKKHHNLLTFSLMYAFSENYILPLSHDEVVHGKRSLLNKLPGDYWQKFSGLRTFLCYFLCHPGKKLLFMGGEFAQYIEWREDRELDWFLLDFDMHKQYQEYTRTINALYRNEKALWENDSDWSGFEWIDVNNCEQSILVFCRRARKIENFLVILINLQPVGYTNYRIGVPEALTYQEVLNSDAAIFGGSNQMNFGPIVVDQVPWHGRDYSVEIRVPPLGSVILKPVLV